MNIRLKKTSWEIEKDGGRTKQQKQELIESQTYFVVSKCKLLTEIKKMLWNNNGNFRFSHREKMKDDTFVRKGLWFQCQDSSVNSASQPFFS